MMRTIKARVLGRENVTVRVVPRERYLPHTAKFVGCGTYQGRCFRFWRNEGRYYTTEDSLVGRDLAPFAYTGAAGAGAYPPRRKEKQA